MMFRLLFLILPCSLLAQVMDNTASYRQIASDRYVRLHYENDYFSESDEFYTQGINMEFVQPVLRKFPLSYALIHASSKEMKNGLAIEHLGYTPTSIGHNEILYGDRPFAAALFLKTFSILNDSVRHYRVVSALSLGVIGPAAGGEEMQQSIHRWIGDVQPLGWQYQIQNDLVLNYQAEIEKQVFSVFNVFMANVKGGGMLGTLFSKGYGSAVLMAGLFDSPFTSFVKYRKKFQIYAYMEPRINVVGYDATLQGGVFNQSSPYTIAAGDIKRLVYQHNFGIVFKLKRFYAEYFQSFLSQEFAPQGVHRWGGVRIGFGW